MINETDKQIIKNIAKKYNIKKIILFGSSILQDRENNDIDIAIDGISAHDFFKFYSELLFSLSKPIDIIDLSSNSKFVNIIKKEGIPIYG